MLYNALRLFILAAFVAITAASTTSAQTVASRGASHNGVFLNASKQHVQQQGLRGALIRLTLECRKNWGGRSSGTAYAAIIGLDTQEVKNVELSCSQRGGSDGATQVDRQSKAEFFSGTSEVIVVADLDHTTRDAWQEWQSDVENFVKEQVNRTIEGFVGGSVEALKQHAIGAGLSALVL